MKPQTTTKNTPLILPAIQTKRSAILREAQASGSLSGLYKPGSTLVTKMNIAFMNSNKPKPPSTKAATRSVDAGGGATESRSHRVVKAASVDSPKVTLRKSKMSSATTEPKSISSTTSLLKSDILAYARVPGTTYDKRSTVKGIDSLIGISMASGPTVKIPIGSDFIGRPVGPYMSASQPGSAQSETKDCINVIEEDKYDDDDDSAEFNDSKSDDFSLGEEDFEEGSKVVFETNMITPGSERPSSLDRSDEQVPCMMTSGRQKSISRGNNASNGLNGFADSKRGSIIVEMTDHQHNIAMMRSSHKSSMDMREMRDSIDLRSSDMMNKNATAKKKKGYTALSLMIPLNMESEKVMFFERKCAYNPLFMYSIPEIKIQYAKPHKKLLRLSIKIMEACIKEFGYDGVFSEELGGPLVSREETESEFAKYIKDLELTDELLVVFSENTIAPTSVVHDPQGKSRVVIGLPILYREKRIKGVMHHEIGTHFIRKYNDKKQAWYKNRKKFEMKPYLIIEEGLAALNQTIEIAADFRQKPYLFNAALHYYSAYMSSVKGFQELYEDLGKYIRDHDKRWRECVRVKRGLQDTSKLQGMYKDQVYLRGAVDILKNRKKIDFMALHAGKLNLKDFFRLYRSKSINTTDIKLPCFLSDMNRYHAALDRIAKINFITDGPQSGLSRNFCFYVLIEIFSSFLCKRNNSKNI
eukprot:TRINITY_DN945_c0_g1_i4.p1 TRINITY_DN945_c0_g1~~TRINITY_DN945_c0_g1_i4.p1  ORF type:complete len:697 (+),score=142.21 TRINITY_DN945_c0_g1_i4:965-3055(+)